MSDEAGPPSSSGQTSASGDGALDEGRRYWKAAIAHLAPEKREAAWEFYLDRLESSAAADTLGGVMLLLEAHLAFFDGLPARLGLAAQQIGAVFQTPGQPTTTNGGGTSPAVPRLAPASAPRWRWRALLVPGVSAAVGGVAVYVALVPLGISLRRLRPTFLSKPIVSHSLARTPSGSNPGASRRPTANAALSSPLVASPGPSALQAEARRSMCCRPSRKFAVTSKHCVRHPSDRAMSHFALGFDAPRNRAGWCASIKTVSFQQPRIITGINPFRYAKKKWVFASACALRNYLAKTLRKT